MIAEDKGIPHQWFDGTGDVAIARRRPRPDRDHPSVPVRVEPPKLDVSPPEVDLGDVVSADELEPQRIWVINRGGGTLEWSAECREPWVRVETDDSGVLLHVRPPVGRHHAEVVIRATNGETRNVGVHVYRRRALFYVLLSILAITVVAGAVLFSRGRNGDDVHEVTVPGSEQWTSTGVEIVSGDTVTFHADGVVIHNVLTDDSTGPDGDDDPYLQQFNIPGVDGLHSALIGRVGPDGTPFVVGSELTWEAKGSGVLELGINDADVSSNAGAFDVTFERMPPD
jgi:plastocyanin